MRKIFVSATIMAALCSLAFSAAPALGLEFESETSSPSETSSSTAQIIQLGTSGWVECLKMSMTASPELGASKKLKAKLEKYTTCSYNHNETAEVVSVSNCLIVLESAALVELSEEEFAEGHVKLNCKLKIEHVGGCEIVIEEPTTASREYAWTNIDATLGRYESLLQFRLEKLKYTIKGTGCGSNGSNGEYEGSIPIKYVTIFPAM